MTPTILILLTLIFSLLGTNRVYRWLYNIEIENYRTLLSQKKSSEVILGQVAETLAPMLEDFPLEDGENIKDLNFLGNPIDYVLWGKDRVVFIEVKSGKSQLSAKQRRIRKLIKEGKVEFLTHRVPQKLKK